MENNALHPSVIKYIDAYNNFDVDGMLAALHPEIQFTNVTGGEVTHTLNGIAAFKSQAESILPLFSERKQTIIEWHSSEERIKVLIDYIAILAADFPNGLKAGEQLQLKGKSIFRIQDNLIIAIEDIS